MPIQERDTYLTSRTNTIIQQQKRNNKENQNSTAKKQTNILELLVVSAT